MTSRPTARRAVAIGCLLAAVAACTSSADESSEATADASAAGQADSTDSDNSTAATAPADTTSSAPPETAAPTPPSSAPPETGPPETGPPDTGPQDTDPPDTNPQSTGAGACPSVDPGQRVFTLDAGGAVHDVQVFVPSSYDSTEPPALVLNWHGLGSNGAQQALFTGYEVLAESEGFIVVHATGVPLAGDDRNSWEFGVFDDPDRDDAAFADALIDHMLSGYCVDESRVYSTGMSNGGLFTSYLICELADRLAAAASVSGLSHYDGCQPGRAVPYIAMHGTADGVVPYDGTSTTSSLDDGSSSSSFFDQVMPDEFAEFAADMGCDPEPTVEPYSTDVIAHSYSGCDDGVPLIFYEITNGGHTWPNTPFIDQLPPGIGYTTTEIDATVDAWRFFEQHSLPG